MAPNPHSRPMPELPEVETIRASLHPLLLGRVVSHVHIVRADVVRTTHGTAPTDTDLLRNGCVVSTERLGKQLAIIADDGRTLVIQLGMTGQLLYNPRASAAPMPPHTHVRFMLSDGASVLFRDPRRFGRVHTLASRRELLDTHWSGLGPDALAIAAPDLLAQLTRTKRAVKAALLDQRVLAGVGNIYADEALFRARIHPCRRADTLRPQEVDQLAESIRATLAHAITAGGSTIRDYRNPAGAAGAAQDSHSVYGHAGRPCPRCDATLQRVVLAQRSTVFCPGCQPRRGELPRTGFPQSRRRDPKPSQALAGR